MFRRVIVIISLLTKRRKVCSFNENIYLCRSSTHYTIYIQNSSLLNNKFGILVVTNLICIGKHKKYTLECWPSEWHHLGAANSDCCHWCSSYRACQISNAEPHGKLGSARTHVCARLITRPDSPTASAPVVKTCGLGVRVPCDATDPEISKLINGLCTIQFCFRSKHNC